MSIWLDVTTTLEWGRPVVGIVRVEAETARHFLRSGNPDVRFCRFDKAAGSYFKVAHDEIGTALTRLEAGGQPVQFQHTPELPHILSRVAVQPFDAGDVYISLGIDWDQKDMVLLYQLKQQIKLKVLLFCYDIIPILLPQYCVTGVPDKFPKYFADAAWCADKILCISDCSRIDLTNFLKSVGAPIPSLEVIRLGCDIFAERNEQHADVVEAIKRHRFILFVSTIEGRKNHDILYRAYKYLLEKKHSDLPLLVFVGMQGWGVEKLMKDMRSDKRVGPFVRILDHVSDNDLVCLYLNSMFTAYPSLYEGWGLPVAESLAYGKFCLASNAASIPEVGGDLIEYIDPRDEVAWATRLLWYFHHPDSVAAREAEIVRRYRHTSWEQTGKDVMKFAENLAAE